MCIFLINSDVEHLFMYFSSSFFGEVFIQPLSIFNRLFFVIDFQQFLYILA